MKAISTFVIGCTWYLLLPPSSLFGQASFRLQNLYRANGIDAPVFDSRGVPLAGTAYAAELWGGPTQDSLAPAVDVDRQYTRLIVPFLSGGSFISTSSFLSVTSVPPRGSAWLEVR